MPTQPVEPRGNAGGVQTPFAILGLAWGVIVLVWLAWVAGRIAAVVTGSAAGPAFGDDFVQALLGRDWSSAWPGVPLTLVAVIYGVLLVAAVSAVTAVWMWWQGRRPPADDPLPALASPAEVRAMTLPEVAQRARRLRPSLADQEVRSIEAASAGVVMGEHRRRGRRHGAVLYSSWEDVLVAIMAPRAGKTTALAVPAVLNAPGPVIATSNKADLWAVTAQHRSEHGIVWVFDPQSITHERQSWWWNPLASVTNIEDAQRLADHFVQQIRTGNGGDDFWILGALDLLTSLILAAALEGDTLMSVQRWLSDSTAREPGEILKAHGYPAAARAMAGRQAGAPETREGLYETARTAAACLANPLIMAWVTPPPHQPLPSLDVHSFPATTDTVFLLSKDGAGNAAPLVAGLADQLLREAVRAAEFSGGRLDAPMVAVLDEAANICKIRDLPELYSHLGSRGIIPLTILQSYRQGTRVWGEQGMDTLWSAATAKLIGAGIDDAKFAEDLSRLVGEHDITVGSRTRDGRGGTSWQTSVRRQRILDAAQIRAMPKGTALLLATGVRAAMLTLLPWYSGPMAAELSAAAKVGNARITANANRGRPARGNSPANAWTS
ncbi:TraM recognition domain-containing protein [Micromonospora arborensis]|uniref:type IV secretory system conjugative DNA transfer family protein n=1 Tax=Micromonospora arborensis TaxID=2116518 RepID=UPI00340FD5A3